MTYPLILAKASLHLHSVAMMAVAERNRNKPRILTSVPLPPLFPQTRLQFKAPTGRALYRNLFDVFRKSVARNGLAGLYQGVESKILLGFFSEGVKLLFKDR